MSKAIILGNGPSLNGTEGWGRELGFAVVYGVNRSYDVSFHHNWVTADEIALSESVRHFEKGVNNWPSRIITTTKALAAHAANSDGPVLYRSNMHIFHSAGFSGTLAMRAAALMGHEEIYLVGFDGGDGSRFYDKGIGDVREEFGMAYTSLRDMIVEGFPKIKWFLYDVDAGFQEYNHETPEDIEGWVRA